ncbi:MAG TPA: hypothetical protein VHM23_17465 [Actinomycetota bacterium]|jgi:hypothetical protein|nr:hypothetical protein [Actinomycetota bacterium]
MQRRALAMLVLALLLAAVPTAAQAKGASAARISGGGPGGLPGGPIDLKGDGEPGSGTSLANLAEAAGVFALLWEDGQSGALDSAPLPPAQRGARYTITWTFPNGDGGEDQVRQSVWPYAAGGPLTFMGTGQRVLDGTTKGGWYRAGDNLRQLLVDLGLPNRPALNAPAPATPAPATPAPAAEPSPALWPKVAGGVVLLLALAAAVALILRRRSASPGPAPTH